jgi:hypothetical protein
MLVDILDPELERLDEAGLKRRRKALGKRSPDLLRADQVETASTPFAPSEVLRELSGDFIQGQAGTFAVEAS